MNKTYEFVCLKMDRGYVMVRDYNLNQCYSGGYDLKLKYKKKYMIIPHAEIHEKALKIDHRKFNSHFDNSSYKIYHFKWKPFKSEDAQMSLFPDEKVETLTENKS